MKCRNAKVIFDPFEFLPGYGENRISVSFDKGDLIVTVFYDSDDSESQISLVFKHSCFQRITSMPGASDTVIEYEGYEAISSLVEFQYSDFKDRWEKHFNNLFKLRHFKIIFLSDNSAIEVICEDFILDS